MCVLYLINLLYFHHNSLSTQSSPGFIFQQTHTCATLAVELNVTEVKVTSALPC